VNVVSVRQTLCSTLYVPFTLEEGRRYDAPNNWFPRIIGSQHIMEVLYLQARHRIVATVPDIDFPTLVYMMPTEKPCSGACDSLIRRVAVNQISPEYSSIYLSIIFPAENLSMTQSCAASASFLHSPGLSRNALHASA